MDTPILLVFDGSVYVGDGEYIEHRAAMVGVKRQRGLGNWELMPHSSCGCGCCQFDPSDDKFIGWIPIPEEMK